MKLEYDEQLLSENLVAKYDYSPEHVKFMLEDLRGMQKHLRAAFSEWLSTETTPSLEIEGYTFDILRKRFGMNPFAAFLTLDSLLTNPERAKRTLSRGFDRIVRTRDEQSEE